nr:MFS transporter [Hymenobacter roseosalivarius]
MFLLLAALLGAGTALVYPTFLAAVAEYAPAPQRARSVGIFRLWRDAGYAVGALLTGLLADAFGLPSALAAIGGLTVLSALVIRRRMHCPPVEADSAAVRGPPQLSGPPFPGRFSWRDRPEQFRRHCSVARTFSSRYSLERTQTPKPLLRSIYPTTFPLRYAYNAHPMSA